MKKSTSNIIFKIISIALAISSFFEAIMVWFFNAQVSMFSVGCDLCFIGLIATLAATSKR